jgi:hypothetical protein
MSEFDPIEDIADWMNNHPDFGIWFKCLGRILLLLGVIAGSLGVLAVMCMALYKLYTGVGMWFPITIISLLSITTLYWDFERRLEKNRHKPRPR